MVVVASGLPNGWPEPGENPELGFLGIESVRRITEIVKLRQAML